MTVREALRLAERRLAEAGVDTPRGDAEWIAAASLRVRRSLLVAHGDEPFPDGTRERFDELVARRARREPLAYVLGTVSFRGLELEIGPGAFVPRPETEITAERAIERSRERARTHRPNVVDVGTGCGAIALSLAAAVPEARVYATEPTGAARGWALRNLARTGLRVTLLPGRMLDPLHPALGGCVDVVVSNPPYVENSLWDSLPEEVRRYEPREAVVGGPTGMEVILELLDDVRMWLAPGGWVVLEIDPSQAERLTKLLPAVGYEEVSAIDDLAGRPRVIEARWVGAIV